MAPENVRKPWGFYVFRGYRRGALTRNSLPQMFYKIVVVKNFAIFTGNTCVGVSFLSATLLKRDSNTVIFL